MVRKISLKWKSGLFHYFLIQNKNPISKVDVLRINNKYANFINDPEKFTAYEIKKDLYTLVRTDNMYQTGSFTKRIIKEQISRSPNLHELPLISLSQLTWTHQKAQLKIEIFWKWVKILIFLPKKMLFVSTCLEGHTTVFNDSEKIFHFWGFLTFHENKAFTFSALEK